MRYAAAVITLAMLLCAALAIAQICPPTPEGYIRQYRPEGTPANYPPPGEPACYMQGTQASLNYASCILCHDYLQRRQA